MKTEKTWEQLENETEEAYAAFQYYLNLMPTERKVMTAYENYCKENKLPKPKTIEKSWSQWSRAFKWVSRADDYDNYKTQELRRYANQDALNEIIEFRKDQRALARKVTGAALALIDAAMARFRTLDPNEISATALPNYLKAAAAIAEIGTDAESRVLMLQEIIETIQENLTDYEEQDEEVIGTVF